MHPALERLATFERFGIHLGLERMEALLAQLDNPQECFPAVHIAGTNGKGSVAAMLDAIVRAAGYTTGLYTSPHLQRKTERVRVDGRELSEEQLAGVLEGAVYPAVDRLDRERFGNTTEFEVLTAAAFVAFARSGVRLGILEVGLGGRLDATNVLPRPLVSAITPIAFDHTERLGYTLVAIAREKAGIIKAGCPVVSSVQEPEVEAVIRSRCSQAGVPLRLADPARITPADRLPDAQTFDWREADGIWTPFELALIGRHQLDNAAVVLTALEVLREQGIAVPAEYARRGLSRVEWPGRLERLPGPGFDWLLDGAHNPAAARALVRALADHFPGTRFVVVFAAPRDKDAGGMLAHLAPVADTLVLTQAPVARARSAASLATLLAEGAGRVAVSPDHREALEFAAQTARSLDPSPTAVLICGSLYLVGAARAILRDGVQS